MKREEAIVIIQELWRYKETDKYTESEIRQALQMAIKALEQKPSKDMEEIEEVINCDADAETKCKMISNILTAKPHYFEKQEPKTGHWIDSINGYFTHCSECGLYGDKGIYKHYGWCPNCGCRMVEPQESEE